MFDPASATTAGGAGSFFTSSLSSRSAASRIGVSGFFTSWAIARAASTQAPRRSARMNSVRSSRTRIERPSGSSGRRWRTTTRRTRSRPPSATVTRRSTGSPEVPDASRTERTGAQAAGASRSPSESPARSRSAAGFASRTAPSPRRKRTTAAVRLERRPTALARSLASDSVRSRTRSPIVSNASTRRDRSTFDGRAIGGAGCPEPIRSAAAIRSSTGFPSASAARPPRPTAPSATATARRTSASEVAPPRLVLGDDDGDRVAAVARKGLRGFDGPRPARRHAASAGARLPLSLGERLGHRRREPVPGDLRRDRERPRRELEPPVPVEKEVDADDARRGVELPRTELAAPGLERGATSFRDQAPGPPLRLAPGVALEREPDEGDAAGERQRAEEQDERHEPGPVGREERLPPSRRSPPPGRGEEDEKDDGQRGLSRGQRRPRGDERRLAARHVRDKARRQGFHDEPHRPFGGEALSRGIPGQPCSCEKVGRKLGGVGAPRAGRAPGGVVFDPLDEDPLRDVGLDRGRQERIPLRLARPRHAHPLGEEIGRNRGRRHAALHLGVGARQAERRHGLAGRVQDPEGVPGSRERRVGAPHPKGPREVRKERLPARREPPGVVPAPHARLESARPVVRLAGGLSGGGRGEGAGEPRETARREPCGAREDGGRGEEDDGGEAAEGVGRRKLAEARHESPREEERADDGKCRGRRPRQEKPGAEEDDPRGGKEPGMARRPEPRQEECGRTGRSGQEPHAARRGEPRREVGGHEVHRVEEAGVPGPDGPPEKDWQERERDGRDREQSAAGA